MNGRFVSDTAAVYARTNINAHAQTKFPPVDLHQLYSVQSFLWVVISQYEYISTSTASVCQME
jgi:hypothetical protein